MIYIAELTREDGSTKKHSGRPTKKYLMAHPEFVKYYESGKHNEYLYRTEYDIVNGKLVEKSDHEIHERGIGVCNF